MWALTTAVNVLDISMRAGKLSGVGTCEVSGSSGQGSVLPVGADRPVLALAGRVTGRRRPR